MPTDAGLNCEYFPGDFPKLFKQFSSKAPANNCFKINFADITAQRTFELPP